VLTHHALLSLNFQYNSENFVSQSDCRIQILLLFDWLARFSILQPDVARTAINHSWLWSMGIRGWWVSTFWQDSTGWSVCRSASHTVL